MTSLVLDPRHIRSHTYEDLARLGAPPLPDRFPLAFAPGDDLVIRPLREIEARAAILNIIQARVFDMPEHLAMRWLLDAHVLDDLTPDEWQFIATGNGDPRRFAEQLEALFCLAWLLGLVGGLDPLSMCDEGLPNLMPDLRTGEPFSTWRSRAMPLGRDAHEVAGLLDLYYCLDWLCADARRRNMPTPSSLDESVVWHRRWALEWAVAVRGASLRPWDRVDF